MGLGQMPTFEIADFGLASSGHRKKWQEQKEHKAMRRKASAFEIQLVSLSLARSVLGAMVEP